MIFFQNLPKQKLWHLKLSIDVSRWYHFSEYFSFLFFTNAFRTSHGDFCATQKNSMDPNLDFPVSDSRKNGTNRANSLPPRFCRTFVCHPRSKSRCSVSQSLEKSQESVNTDVDFPIYHLHVSRRWRDNFRIDTFLKLQIRHINNLDSFII